MRQNAVPFLKRRFSRDEVLIRPCPIPKCSGVYSWYFREIPPQVPTEECVQEDGLTLLYVGIAPKAPPASGVASRQTLRKRIRYHFRGNAEGSTLRLTLGCLLADHLGIQLRRVGSGKRMTFTEWGENSLSNWMGENAFVTWLENEVPWELELQLINTLSLPLNLQGNRNHPFSNILSTIRSNQRRQAKVLPII